MTKQLHILYCIMLTGMSAFAQPEQTLKDADIVIRHVNVLTMKDSIPLNDQCVCIDKGRISYIGKDVLPEKPATTGKVIDARNQYLMPGMAEMHVHLPETEKIKHFLTMNLMAGVTTLRSMRGKPEQPAYRKVNYPIPDMVLASPIITRKTPLDEHSADSLVRKYKADGFDCIKVIEIKDSTAFATLMKAARKYHMQVAGHMLYNIDFDYLLNNGYSTIEHLGGHAEAVLYSEDYYREMAALTKKNNIYLCPTMDWYKVVYQLVPEPDLKKRYGLHLMPDSVLTQWDNDIAKTKERMKDSATKAAMDKYAKIHPRKLHILKDMSDMGIPMVLGSEGGDTYMVPGFNMAEEMKAFKEAGISNYKILQYATITAAQYLGKDKVQGTVEKGKIANLVLLNANPLQDLDAVSTVHSVFLHGKHYTEKELQASIN